METIQLTKGYVVVVDNEDYERVSDFKWHAGVEIRADGSIRVYAKRRVRKPGGGRTTQFLHRVIMNAPDGLEVDHIDGNPLNNTRENLRICSHSENMRNARVRTGGSSRFKGVSWYKRDRKWQAQICVDGELKHLGYFDYESDAANAYDKMAIEHFGEFAKLNRCA